MRVEQDVLNAKTKNRHVAEERNQVEQTSDNEDEEGKYGATDRRNRKKVAGQDGGVFEKGGKGRRDTKLNCPPGKFTAFHKQIDKTALRKMHE